MIEDGIEIIPGCSQQFTCAKLATTVAPIGPIALRKI